MKISILTIFPEIVNQYFAHSIMKRAAQADVAHVTTHNIRDFSTSKHRNVDDTPYGGGAGMVMQVEPIHRAVQSVTQGSADTADTPSSRIIVLSAKGKRYTQEDAQRLSRYDHLIFICGRYEGIDERVAEHIADEELSIGDYVLTGGELGAMVITDSVVRLLPGALGNDDSAIYESHSEQGYTEHPHYTKPEQYNGWTVPEDLLSGDHAKIAAWRKESSSQSPEMQ